MKILDRAYYHSSFHDFLAASNEEIIGRLSIRSELSLEQRQRNAWKDELEILRHALEGLDGYVLLEYSIPRMGKRADAILLFPRVVIVVEFKVGEAQL